MIHFVGAGPGAADLITLRGAELLKTADAVVYTGSLINTELLDLTRTGCELHNSAAMTLDEVIAVLLRVNSSGGAAVRLHTGDPSIYGAIREQMDALNANGAEYAVCPGVSSFCGAAAALKAEYTLPGVSQSVIITRMAGRTPVPKRESISALAAHAATMVIFLSAGMAAALQSELLEGFAPDTPAAIVYKATWADERVLRCTVGTLAECSAESGISNHALIVVGKVLGGDYELSKLYDPAFSTAFREASR
ncbi:MAG: precorrin-4 C(11)-methyltransferase [Oscillospiraceae bacterium]|jgi:precorrin-4/cobalt-precorrin-4 C11-methyltransferase|nr:precorrin-4 C(11)-methyltransferase [Oscillospiraceae bacterium]